jgi:hypothetical protein
MLTAKITYFQYSPIPFREIQCLRLTNTKHNVSVFRDISYVGKICEVMLPPLSSPSVVAIPIIADLPAEFIRLQSDKTSEHRG